MVPPPMAFISYCCVVVVLNSYRDINDDFQFKYSVTPQIQTNWVEGLFRFGLFVFADKSFINTVAYSRTPHIGPSRGRVEVGTQKKSNNQRSKKTRFKICTK